MQAGIMSNMGCLALCNAVQFSKKCSTVSSSVLHNKHVGCIVRGKALPTRLTMCSLCILAICNFSYFSYWFRGRNSGFIAPVLCHCILVTSISFWLNAALLHWWMYVPVTSFNFVVFRGISRALPIVRSTKCILPYRLSPTFRYSRLVYNNALLRILLDQ